MRIVGQFRSLKQGTMDPQDGSAPFSWANVSILDEDSGLIVKVKPLTGDPEDVAELVEFAADHERGEVVQVVVIADGKGNPRFQRAL